MSIGLKTKIRAGLELDNLIQDSQRALQEILNLSVLPALRAVQFIDKNWRPLSGPRELGAASPIIGLSIQGEPEIASVSIYKRTPDRFPAPDWKPEELGEIASVEVCGIRTGLSFALVGAISVAIARHSGGLIADDMKFYTSSFDSPPEDFVSSTRVAVKMNDCREASNQFELQLLQNKSIRNLK